MCERSLSLSPIVDGEEYALSASDDGDRFALSFKPDRRIANLLGEDAERFKADYRAIVARHPRWNADQMLSRLWDQGGYGWLASEEE